MSESLTVEVHKIIFHNAANNWTVMKGEHNGSRVMAVGRIGPRKYRERVTLQGKWITHPKYGEQFSGDATDLEARIEVERKTIHRALAECGLSESALARRIKKMEMPEILALLHNPYTLTSSRGTRWKDIDSLALALGFSTENPHRLDAWIRRTFNSPVGTLSEHAKSSAGCWFPAKPLVREASSALSVPAQKIQELLADDSLPSLTAISHPEPAISRTSIVSAETVIAEKVQEILSNCILDIGFPGIVDESLSEEQRFAVFTACHSGFSITTGSPGTGKTRCIKEIALAHAKLGLKVMLAAPTGKAANRLSEVVGITGQTIHRLLSVIPGTKSGQFEFLFNENNPLPPGLVIVDETSMADTKLLGDLLRACTNQNRVVLVGDPNQLPPVGAGQPFLDLIQTEAVPICRLSRIFRQAEGSAIAQACAHTIKGNPAELLLYLRSTDAQKEINTIFIEDDSEIPAQVLEARKSVNSEDDVSLCPTKIGDFGTFAINKAIQIDRHAGSGLLVEFPTKSFYFGDPVMQLRNDYERRDERGIFNGDTGVAIGGGSSKKNGLSVLFPETNNVETRTFQEFYTREQAFEDLVPAYAITIHKSQGSEWDHVIVAIPRAASFFLTTQMLYTAFSRAKKRLTIIANKKTIQGTLQKGVSRQPAKTRLQWLLLREKMEVAA